MTGEILQRSRHSRFPAADLSFPGVPMAGATAGAGEGRRIVVAVDEGEESLYALSWGLRNVVAAPGEGEGGGGGSKDTVVLLYARPPRVVHASLDGTGYLFSSDITAIMDGYSKEAAAAVLAKAKSLCAADHPNVRVEARVGVGDPRDVICETVEELGADMLVVGSHGYGPVKRAFLGSVSNHCAQNVKCPVLIVKRPKH